mgnify:CR=1 FL=1
MRMTPLGRSGLMVSELCLGTMTFGTQTSEQEAHAQIDMALEGGINFRDLGGYLNRQGKTIKWRKIMRCGHLANLSEHDLNVL